MLVLLFVLLCFAFSFRFHFANVFLQFVSIIVILNNDFAQVIISYFSSFSYYQKYIALNHNKHFVTIEKTKKKEHKIKTTNIQTNCNKQKWQQLVIQRVSDLVSKKIGSVTETYSGKSWVF